MSNEMIRELSTTEIDMVSGAWSLGGGFELGGGYSSEITTFVGTEMDFSGFTGSGGIEMNTDFIGGLLDTFGDAIGGLIGGLLDGINIDLGLF